MGKETKVIAQTGFSNEEVVEFRSLFVSAGLEHLQERTKIVFDDFVIMLDCIMGLGPTEVEELSTLFNKFTPDRRRGADFPEFLLLMHRILESNFAGIKKKLMHVTAPCWAGSRNASKADGDFKKNVAKRMSVAIAPPPPSFKPGDDQLIPFGQQK